jgi:hypothetical protein
LLLGVSAVLVGAALLSLPDCGSGSSAKSTGCVSGQSIACAGVHGCAGYQVCRSDGTGYGACLCGDAGSRAFPNVGPYSGLLGAACSSPEDCRLGLECVTPDSNLVHGEGPSSGMCLTRCLVDHNLCNEVDATAKCVVVDDGGTSSTSDDIAYCLPGCKLGTQPDSQDKCRGRVDLACNEDPVGAGAGYCKPVCRSDIDCAPRMCDLATGLCADAAAPGPAIGSSCDPSNSNCPGGCYSPTSSYSECSGLCNYGTQGCGESSDLPFDSFCAIGGAVTSGPGDLGYCAKLCDCDADCGRSDAVCEPKSGYSAKTGHTGVCGSKTLPSGAARANSPCK